MVDFTCHTAIAEANEYTVPVLGQPDFGDDVRAFARVRFYDNSAYTFSVLNGFTVKLKTSVYGFLVCRDFTVGKLEVVDIINNYRLGFLLYFVISIYHAVKY